MKFTQLEKSMIREFKNGSEIGDVARRYGISYDEMQILVRLWMIEMDRKSGK